METARPSWFFSENCKAKLEKLKTEAQNKMGQECKVE